MDDHTIGYFMKPFLKWAGSKQKIMPIISNIIPQGARLVEPFFGSGSVMLNTDFCSYLAADINQDLINLYQILQQEGDDFIQYCKTFFTDENRIEERFYELRELFNSTTYVREKSALFVYLNRHCFNGLCRYNTKGGFNVPFGKYDTVYFPEQEMIDFYHKSQHVIFIHSPFDKTMEECYAGDVVYCDPPYAPLTDTSNFTAYVAESFGEEEQILLANLAKDLTRYKIPVIISNHDTVQVREWYSEANYLISIPVQRTIAASGTNRNKVKEIIALYDDNNILTFR